MIRPVSKSDILNKLAYFAVFNYPLSLEELKRFCLSDSVEEELNQLILQGAVYQHGNYYSLQKNEEGIKSRIEGNNRCEDYTRKAKKNARLISKFPFVRGVLISGSLSKGYMPEDGDVDYFIITQKNRLWIARTSLILYKKVFLLNSRKYFCVNYFVDEENLEIPHKNIFTATEIITLLPMVNNKLHLDFISKNEWVNHFYSNEAVSDNNAIDFSKKWFQKITEPFFNNRFGEWLDQYFMRLTLKKWNLKFSEMNKQDFEIAMRTTRRTSKHHPSNFQKSVMEKHQSILSEASKKINVNTI